MHGGDRNSKKAQEASSRRTIGIFAGLSLGLSNPEIAKRENMTVKTLNQSLLRIYREIGYPITYDWSTRHKLAVSLAGLRKTLEEPCHK